MQSFKHIGIQPAVKNKFHSCMNIRRYGEKLLISNSEVGGMNRDNVEARGAELYPRSWGKNNHDLFGECSFVCELNSSINLTF